MIDRLAKCHEANDTEELFSHKKRCRRNVSLAVLSATFVSKLIYVVLFALLCFSLYRDNSSSAVFTFAMYDETLMKDQLVQLQLLGG